MVPVSRTTGTSDAGAARKRERAENGSEFGCQQPSAHECYPQFGVSG
jgi:hypothetical protein